MSKSSQTLQEDASINEFFSLVATETLALFEYLEFEFLYEFDVVAPASRGQTRKHHPPELFRAFLHCYYKDIYGTRPVARELQHSLVWYDCGLDRPPSRDTIDRFLTDLEQVIDDVFNRLVEQAAARGLLDSTYSIDSTHVEAIQHNDAASWNYNPTAEEYYYGFGCTTVSTGAKIPIAAEFTQAKRASQETAMRVTRSPSKSRCGCLETAPTISLIGTITCCSQGSCLSLRTIPVTLTTRKIPSTGSKTASLNTARTCNWKQSILEETYNNRTGVERTNDAVKDCGLGHVRARGRVHARTELYVALCLRLVVAITNYERGNNPGCENL